MAWEPSSRAGTGTVECCPPRLAVAAPSAVAVSGPGRQGRPCAGTRPSWRERRGSNARGGPPRATLAVPGWVAAPVDRALGRGSTAAVSGADRAGSPPLAVSDSKGPGQRGFLESLGDLKRRLTAVLFFLSFLFKQQPPSSAFHRLCLWLDFMHIFSFSSHFWGGGRGERITHS